MNSDKHQKIKNLLHNKNFEQALRTVYDIEQVNISLPIEIVRLKSIAESGIGEIDKALSSLESIFAHSDQPSDWHLAGEFAIELGYMQKALKYTTKAIDLSLEKNDSYYLDTCYLERAYVYHSIGENEKAIDDLHKVDEESNVFWINNISPINKQSLLMQINL